MTDDDRDLRRLLGELREKDARDTPPFESILARRLRPAARVRFAPRHAIATAIAIAAVLLLIVAPRLSREPERRISSIELGSWQSPTAFLLEPPRALPRVDGQSITGSIIPDIPLHISQEKSP